jgi:hypothetical protein
MEDIGYAHELLLVNREYPTQLEEDPQVEAQRQNEHAQSNKGTDAGAESEIIETSCTTIAADLEGHKYATFDDLGGWKMH